MPDDDDIEFCKASGNVNSDLPEDEDNDCPQYAEKGRSHV